MRCANCGEHDLLCDRPSPRGYEVDTMHMLSECVDYWRARAAQAEKERNVYREALEAMVWQWGYPATRGGVRGVGSGGFSVSEMAFAVLGWSDPHFPEEAKE